MEKHTHQEIHRGGEKKTPQQPKPTERGKSTNKQTNKEQLAPSVTPQVISTHHVLMDN